MWVSMIVMPLTVLVVDEQEQNLQPYAKVASRIDNTRVVCFTSSSGALRYLRANDTALVVLDLFVSRPDAFGFLKKMRAAPELADIPVIGVTASGREDAGRRALALGASVIVNKPINAADFIRKACGLLGQSVPIVGPRFRTHPDRVQSVIREHELVEKLFAALRTRDRQFETHANLTTAYAEQIARAAKIPPAQIQLLTAAAPLHDIGMLSTPEYVLLKVVNLDARERAIIKEHAKAGYEILRDSSSKVLQAAATIALTHHENWDGTGYPAKLKGTDIPLFGRVVALAGAYAAMTTRRPYRKALTSKEAVSEIDAASGYQFDPDLVRAFHLAFREISRFQLAPATC
jgi:putative two-component system response regulator